MLGRPYYYTFEILDKQEGESYSRLRVVPPSELNAEAVAGDASPSESRGDPGTPNAGNGIESSDLLREASMVLMKNNRLTVDDAGRQGLSQQQIEQLKKTASGRDIIDTIMANHAGLDEKTAFSKAKYTLRKSRKYLKRFTTLPMDIGNLIDYTSAKEASRIMELRDETLALMMVWSNVHYTDDPSAVESNDQPAQMSRGNWLVLDETGGLVVAAMAERMNILFKPDAEGIETANNDHKPSDVDGTHIEEAADGETEKDQARVSKTPVKHLDFPMPAQSNSLTLLHPAIQPNLSLLKYFGYDTNQPDPLHPLHIHLKPLSWLQLLHPEDDVTYTEPEYASEETLQSWKSGKRGAYWKKRRRWGRCKAIVDETHAGGFDGLVIASNLDLTTVLPHLIPRVRGGGHVVIYSPTSESLVKVMDLYSKERRAAYISQLARRDQPDSEDFPVDPRLLLAPTLQTSRTVDWQVLPGRTHPMMTSRGGAEGYVFTARRVIPLEGGVDARGNFSTKKRKAGEVDATAE